MWQQRWTLFRTARAVTWLRTKGQIPNKRRERRGTNRVTWLLASGSPSQPAACSIPSSIILYGNCGGFVVDGWMDAPRKPRKP
jgi:hypothetical protein